MNNNTKEKIKYYSFPLTLTNHTIQFIISLGNVDAKNKKTVSERNPKYD